jgi:hypothetical protein
VLRQLRDGVDLSTDAVATPVRTRRPSSREKVRQRMVLGAIAVFAALAVVLLVTTIRGRGNGGSLTGNTPGATVDTKKREATLQAAVRQHPKDYAARIALARFYLSEDLEKAVREYDTAAQLDSRQPEPLAYGGWIRAIVAGRLETSDANRKLLVDTAQERFDRAIKIAPSYPDTFVFRGILRYEVLNDLQDAKSDFQRYLELAPQDDQFRSLVTSTLANVQAQLTPGSTTIPPG